MNLLASSPFGACFARPWVDGVGLSSARSLYLPLSRLWAEANLPGGRNRASFERAEAARQAWEQAIFSAEGDESRSGVLDAERRRAASWHLATRGRFLAERMMRAVPIARWHVSAPDETERVLAAGGDRLAWRGETAVQRSASFVRKGLRDYWLRAPTPSPHLAARPGSETLYARVVEPADGSARETLISGSGLCLEFELLALDEDPGRRLARLGWRVIEPISPYHGLRAMPGFYGGEPFFALAPLGTVDLVMGQAIETGVLIAWARRRFGGPVALSGISMSSFVAQQVAGGCDRWPAEARPDGVLLISHSCRAEEVTFSGELAAALGLDRALLAVGWTHERLAGVSAAIDPAPVPALTADRIVSALGTTDRWVPYSGGADLAARWKLPESNRFEYALGHLGMPVQLMRDAAPFERLRQVLRA
jgi:hypothetical protein